MGSSKHHSSSSRKRRHDRESDGSVEEERDERRKEEHDEDGRSPNEEENGERRKHHKSSRHHRHHKKHKRKDEDEEDDELDRKEEDDSEEKRHRHHKKKKEKKSKRSKKKKRKLEDEYEAISDEDLSGKEGELPLRKDDDDLSSLSLSPSPVPKKDKRRERRSPSPERRRSPSPRRRSPSPREVVRQRPRDEATGGQGATSLSIDETNKLRAKLGLKPLKMDGPKEQEPGEKPTMVEGGVQMDEFVHKPATNISKTKKEEELREKLRVRREKRELEAKLKKKTPLLAADDDDDDDSAVSWVKKARDHEKEKREAEKRAKMLEEMDKEFGLDDLVEDEFVQEKRKVEKKKQYTGDHLKGVRVKHSVKDLAEGRDIVLTLEDKNVLDEEEDVLANVNLKDVERARKNIKNRSKKGTYDAYDEDEEEDEELGPTLLKQYDEVITGEKADSFILGGSKTKVEPTEAERLSIKKKLKQVESLAAAPEVHMLAREYYTKEEYDAKFKKKKKKVKAEAIRGNNKGKKKKGLTADDLLDDLAEPLDSQPVPMDVDMDEDDEDFVPLKELDDEDLSSIVLEPDEAQLELEATLGRARRMREAKLKETNQETSVERLAKAIRERKEEAEREDEPLYGMSEEILTFNETAEFARSLGNRPDASVEDDIFAKPPRTPTPEPLEEDVVEEMDISSEDEDIVELKQDAAGKWSKAKDVAKKDDQKPSTSKEPVTVTDLEEEAGVSSSMVAALKLAAKKGYLDEGTKKKNPNAMSLAALKALNYTIEDKSSIDDEFRGKRGGGGDHRERYSGPTSDFKDKDNYKPEINLEYIDDQGRKLTPKEAFRYLSHKFHGKGSGKMKTEKRMKKLAEQTAVRQMSSTDTPLGTVGKMKEKQKESHTPFLVISGNKVTSAGGLLSSLGKS